MANGSKAMEIFDEADLVEGIQDSNFHEFSESLVAILSPWKTKKNL